MVKSAEKNFHEGFRAEDVAPPPPRSTGIVFAVVALIIAILFRNTDVVFWGGLAVSAGFALSAWLVPERLGPLNRAWFKFALLLNRIMSPVIMFVLFGRGHRALRTCDAAVSRSPAPEAPCGHVELLDSAQPTAADRPQPTVLVVTPHCGISPEKTLPDGIALA